LQPADLIPTGLEQGSEAIKEGNVRGSPVKGTGCFRGHPAQFIMLVGDRGRFLVGNAEEGDQANASGGIRERNNFQFAENPYPEGKFLHQFPFKGRRMAFPGFNLAARKFPEKREPAGGGPTRGEEAAVDDNETADNSEDERG